MKDTVISLLIVFASAAAAAMPAGAQTKRALLIGVSDYGNAMEDPDRWANINGANDIALLSPLFEAEGYTVRTLTDAEATYAGITSALTQLAQECTPGDRVYLHFSMHGQPFEDLDGDEADGWDEALIPVDAQMIYAEGVYDGTNHLLDDQLSAYCDAIRSHIGPEGNLTVVLDACHSGTASRGVGDSIRGTNEGFTRSGKEYYPDTAVESNDSYTLSTAEGQSPVTFVEACRSYQVNREVRDPDTDVWYGSLSYYGARAMRSGIAAGSDEWLDPIRGGMASNRKLRRQNIVVERSE